MLLQAGVIIKHSTNQRSRNMPHSLIWNCTKLILQDVWSHLKPFALSEATEASTDSTSSTARAQRQFYTMYDVIKTDTQFQLSWLTGYLIVPLRHFIIGYPCFSLAQDWKGIFINSLLSKHRKKKSWMSVELYYIFRIYLIAVENHKYLWIGQVIYTAVVKVDEASVLRGRSAVQRMPNSEFSH